MRTEIPKADDLAGRVFSVSNEKEFQQIALQIFGLQFAENKVYQAYCAAIGKTPGNVRSFTDIPFLPISLFKTHAVKTGEFEAEAVFRSSGTTGATTSCHFVKNLSLYEKSFFKCFEAFYEKAASLCVLGLLPSYLEQGASSLVYMVDALVKKSGHPQSGFYLYDHQRLNDTLLALEAAKQPTVLFGVTYALLDFAARFRVPLKYTTIIETGGMKGRRKELSKPALYEALKERFLVPEIHSEYGMTELLSQAYAINGLYRCPPWMKVMLRDETDPFAPASRTGAINVIDLANIWSCAFIATEDLGRQHADGSFEVLGRMDNTDMRGCSQMAL